MEQHTFEKTVAVEVRHKHGADMIGIRFFWVITPYFEDGEFR